MLLFSSGLIKGFYQGVESVLKILDKVFNDNYYRIKEFEQNGEIYKKVGVKKFKRAKGRG